MSQNDIYTSTNVYILKVTQKMARRTKEEAQQTRETILVAALDMFCDKGYTRTTFDEIAKKINLTKGAIYWHFRNKPDIIKALIIEAFERNQAVINREIPEVKTLSDLLRYFKYEAQMVRDIAIFRKFLFFVMYQMEWSEGLFNTLNISGPINQIKNFHHEMITKVLTDSIQKGEIRKDIDISMTSQIITALWDGILHQAIGKNYHGDFPELTEQSFQLIFKSLKTKEDN